MTMDASELNRARNIIANAMFNGYERHSEPLGILIGDYRVYELAHAIEVMKVYFDEPQHVRPIPADWQELPREAWLVIEREPDGVGNAKYFQLLADVLDVRLVARRLGSNGFQLGIETGKPNFLAPDGVVVVVGRDDASEPDDAHTSHATDTSHAVVAAA